MAHAPITLGSGGGYGSDDCTGTLDYVVSGKTVIAKDSDDEPGTGRMTVNSLLSFSVAAYSGRRVLAKWQNPKAATGRPYSGVYIRYSTSGYPGKTGGTQIYKGAGSNTSSGGQSQAYLDLPALSTKYYLSIYPYVTCSVNGVVSELTGTVINATVTTSAPLRVVIKSDQTYTIPAGYKKMDICTVGGGEAGFAGDGYKGAEQGWSEGGPGGDGGEVVNVLDISISEGQQIAAIIGAGGTSKTNGPGSTTVTRNGVTLATARGGYGSSGGDGGYLSENWKNGYINSPEKGSDGVRAFGDSNEALYGPGGGGAAATGSYFGEREGAAGGKTGGGKGGNAGPSCTKGADGTANTGAGGGGQANYVNVTDHFWGGIGKGGSGVVVLRLR